MKRQTGFNMEIVAKAVRPLSKAEKREQKAKEKEERRAARAAARQKRKEEAAKMEPTVTYAMPSESDIEAARQQLLKEATANALRQSGNGNTVVSVGPVQMVMGGGPGGTVVKPTSTKQNVFTSAPKYSSTGQTSIMASPTKSTTYKVMVHPSSGASIPSASQNIKKKTIATTKKPKSKGVGNLIAKFESSN